VNMTTKAHPLFLAYLDLLPDVIDFATHRALVEWIAAGCPLVEEKPLYDVGRAGHLSCDARAEELKREAIAADANWQQRLAAAHEREVELHRRLVERDKEIGRLKEWREKPSCAGRDDIIHVTTDLWATLSQTKATRAAAFREAAEIALQAAVDWNVEWGFKGSRTDEASKIASRIAAKIEP
jgi:hypothetical protein